MTPFSSFVDVIIIGGGLSGLSLGFWLQHYSPKTKYIIIEKSKEAGGWIATTRSASGQIYEMGPKSIRLVGEKAKAIKELIALLQLENKVIPAHPQAKKRYIIQNGIPQEMPGSSGFFSWLTLPLGRLFLQEMIKEPCTAFFRARPCEKKHPETVAQFFTRVFSSQKVLQIVDAMTTGIWGAHPNLLSMPVAFPALQEIEKRYRSLVIGQLFLFFRNIQSKLPFYKKCDAVPSMGITSFEGGLSTLIEVLKNNLNEPVALSTKIVDLKIRKGNDSENFLWDVGIENSDTKKITTVRAKKIVVACDPMYLPSQFQQFLFSTTTTTAFIDPQGKRVLYPHLVMSSTFSAKTLLQKNIYRSSIVTVALGWKDDFFMHKNKCKILPGFGILAPSCEDDVVLGIVFDSVIFPQHSTTMKTRLSIMIGGTRWPHAIDACEKTLLELALSRVASWLGINALPDETHIFRCPQAIPLSQVDRTHPYLESAIAPKKSLYLLSMGIGGVAISDCVRSAQTLASVLQDC